MEENTWAQLMAIIIIGAIILVVNVFYQYGTVNTIDFIAVNKERIETKYLIFTKNETFKNTDTILHLKFNSSDVYRSIKKGKAYKAKIYGWRVPFLSMYRNILSVKEI